MGETLRTLQGPCCLVTQSRSTPACHLWYVTVAATYGGCEREQVLISKKTPNIKFSCYVVAKVLLISCLGTPKGLKENLDRGGWSVTSV